MYQINSTEKYKIFNCNARALFLAFVVFTVMIETQRLKIQPKKRVQRKSALLLNVEKEKVILQIPVNAEDI